MRRLQHRGMVREPQVVVGAEIDHFAPVGELHDGSLGGADDALALQQAAGVERPRVALESFTKFLQHSNPWIVSAFARRLL